MRSHTHRTGGLLVDHEEESDILSIDCDQDPLATSKLGYNAAELLKSALLTVAAEWACRRGDSNAKAKCFH